MEYNTEDIVNIHNIQFCVFGNDEVKRYSVTNKDPYGINIPETYDSHEPKRGGLIDLRLGTTNNNIICDVRMRVMTIQKIEDIVY